MISCGNMMHLVFRFRNICIEKFPEDVDVLLKEKRDQLLGVDQQEDQKEEFLSTKWAKPIQDICRLAKVPRLLKRILRRTYRIWEHLHGEIDFDNILVANTLRYSAPEAFDFLLENHHEIRGLLAIERSTKHDERVKLIEDKWQAVTQAVNWDSVSAYNLVQFIFPFRKTNTIDLRNESLQSIYVSEPTDYWARYLLEELPLDIIRDQEILLGIKEWKQGLNDVQIRGNTFADLLCTNNEFAKKFEYLAPALLSGKNVRDMASLTFNHGLELYSVKADKDIITGFINLWRLAINNPIDEREHFRWVDKEICKALPKGLRLAIALYYYWRSNSESEVDRKLASPELQEKFTHYSRDIFEHNVSQFIKVLDPSFMYSSYHILHFIGGFDVQGNSFNFSNWKWFSNILLEAGEIDPQTIVPQLACILVRENMHLIEIEYSIKTENINLLFENEKIRLMRILIKEINTEIFNQREIASIEMVQQYASEWLHEERADIQESI